MSKAAESSSIFISLGEEFCWHARNFAAMYGAQHVEIVHILLAAAEVSPLELHGYPQLTPVLVGRTIAELQRVDASDRTTEPLPRTLSPRAQEFVAKVMSFAARTNRTPTMRDVWVALLQEEQGLPTLLLEQLGIDSHELYRRVSGA